MIATVELRHDSRAPEFGSFPSANPATAKYPPIATTLRTRALTRIFIFYQSLSDSFLDFASTQHACKLDPG